MRTAHTRPIFTACVCRANVGAAAAEAASSAREYVFECGEVLDSETGIERVLNPSNERRAVRDAEEVAAAAAEAERASVALPAASAQQQQQKQQQTPAHVAAASQPEGAFADVALGIDQAVAVQHGSSAAPAATATAAAQVSARDGPTPVVPPVEASAAEASPPPVSQSVPQVSGKLGSDCVHLVDSCTATYGCFGAAAATLLRKVVTYAKLSSEGLVRSDAGEHHA